MSTTPILSLNNIEYSVNTDDAALNILRDINLQITSNQSLAIMGSSGSGKTTLLNIMAGLLKSSGGELNYQNQRLNDYNEDQLAKWRLHHVAFIFQQFELLDNLTALENIMLPLEFQQKPNTNIKEEALNWLSKVDLKAKQDCFPSTLSGGEQQRVAIARAFAQTPQILFADEPTGNLDHQTSKLITDLLFELNNTTLIIVTHSSELAVRTQQTYQLLDGRLSCD